MAGEEDAAVVQGAQGLLGCFTGAYNAHTLPMSAREQSSDKQTSTLESGVLEGVPTTLAPLQGRCSASEILKRWKPDYIMMVYTISTYKGSIWLLYSRVASVKGWILGAAQSFFLEDLCPKNS